MWNGRVDSWHEHVTETPAFEQIRCDILHAAHVQPGDTVVDLGAGTGFLTLPLATAGATVLAVDLAAGMIDQLSARAIGADLNVEVKVADIAQLDLPSGSADIVVSNYTLHHLSHAQKRHVVADISRWLRPGGRIIIADMMFGRGATAHDRRVLRAKVRQLFAKGPAGIWRVVKNIVRFGLGVGSERPAPPTFWTAALTDAGFTEVRHQQLVAEAGLVTGVKPTKPTVV